MKILLIISTVLSVQFANAEVGSVYTDLEKDCVEISSSTDKAPIDFYEASCKAFGGFGLSIEGGDLRYSPRLTFGAKKIKLDNPYSFHEIAPSAKVEWLYTLTRDEQGSGKLTWRALIYRLSVHGLDEKTDEFKDKSILYIVRLNGEKSCAIGTTTSNEEARKLALSKAECFTPRE